MQWPTRQTDYTFAIRKQTDHALITAVVSAAKNGPYSINAIRVQPVYADGFFMWTLEEWEEQDKHVNKFLQSDSHLIRILQIQFNGGKSLQVNRNVYTVHAPGENKNSWFDIVNIVASSPPNAQHDPPAIEEFGKFVTMIYVELGAFEVGSSLASMTSEEGRALFGARESALGRMEDLQARFFDELRRFTSDQRKELKKAKERLRIEHENRQAELEAEHKKRSEELDAREKDLEARKKEIDDRSSTHARRKIREDLRKIIEARYKTFELTEGTRRLRRSVFIFCIILMFLFGGAAIFFISTDYQAGRQVETWVLIRQFTFTAAFAAVATFFIRWNHQWFQRHADEEFRLKRLDLDIDRASWLVEMALEYKVEKGEEIPHALINKLGRNLFVDERAKGGDMHPAETLASAIFADEANVSVKTPGFRVEGSRGIRRKAKPKKHKEHDEDKEDEDE